MKIIVELSGDSPEIFVFFLSFLFTFFGNKWKPLNYFIAVDANTAILKYDVWIN